jgi:Tfp pilus assembly protein PilN
VHVLDEVSKSVPDRLWLTAMTQNDKDFTIEGRTMSLTALSDFVANLEGSSWFKRPVEIIDSQVDPNPQAGDLVRFTIRAQFDNKDAPAPGAPAGRGGRPAGH